MPDIGCTMIGNGDKSRPFCAIATELALGRLAAMKDARALLEDMPLGHLIPSDAASIRGAIDILTDDAMLAPAWRDDLIRLAIEALESVMAAEAAVLFDDATLVVDAILARYVIAERETE